MGKKQNITWNQSLKYWNAKAKKNRRLEECP